MEHDSPAPGKRKKDRKEVEFKEKAGTAWSHSYLNQKPWHPLSYPNQRRKWIAEQSHAQKEERRAEVAREFAQEQEFFRQTAQMTKKEKEKMEAMQAVSFMYMRPPGYNAEAARAAELADERNRLGLTTTATVDATPDDGNISRKPLEKNTRSKDVFGRTLPTEEEFPSLKNAPRYDTGAPTRVKPFAVEIRNVKCARCGAFGHQSGDRECPLKDVLMPSEEARLIREDPLNAIMAQTASDELLTWELKQKPGGLSPARGGFKPDDPNQQIIPDEDIYDEYGGFLPGGGGEEGTLIIPNLLASLSHEQRKELTDVNSEKKRKRKKHRRGRREDKRLGSEKSANAGHRYPERDGQRDDRRSSSSQDEQTYRKPRMVEPHLISQDVNKILRRRDESSDSDRDDHGSLKGIGRDESNFRLKNQDRHRSKGMRTSGKIVDSTHNKLDKIEEYQRGTTGKNTSRKGDRRTNVDEESRRVRHESSRDSVDYEQRIGRFKEKREGSKAEVRSDNSVDEERGFRDGNSRHDESSRAGEEFRMHSSDDNLRRLGHKISRNSSDGEQRRLGYKDVRGSDDEQKRLRYKDARGSDDEQRRRRYKDRRDGSDDEQRRLRHKSTRDSSDHELILRRKDSMNNSDEKRRRLRHKDRRNGSESEQGRSSVKKGRSDDYERRDLDT